MAYTINESLYGSYHNSHTPRMAKPVFSRLFTGIFDSQKFKRDIDLPEGKWSVYNLRTDTIADKG